MVKLDDVHEVDSRMEQDSVADDTEKIKKFEQMLEKYGASQDSTRLSLNTKKPNELKPKSNTISVKLQERDESQKEKFDSFGGEIPQELQVKAEKMNSFTSDYMSEVRESKIRQDKQGISSVSEKKSSSFVKIPQKEALSSQ